MDSFSSGQVRDRWGPKRVVPEFTLGLPYPVCGSGMGTQLHSLTVGAWWLGLSPCWREPIIVDGLSIAPGCEDASFSTSFEVCRAETHVLSFISVQETSHNVELTSQERRKN